MTEEFNQLQNSIKIQLKKDYPNLSEEELNIKSHDVAISIEKSKEKLDDQGRIIIGENVKFRINGNINSISE